MIDIEISLKEVVENPKLDPANCYYLPSKVAFSLDLVAGRIPDDELERLRRHASQRCTSPHIFYFSWLDGPSLVSLRETEKKKIRDILSQAPGCRSIIWE